MKRTISHENYMAITFANDINVYIYFDNNICHYQHKQQEDAAMGSPVSPIVANLYMEQFENQAINTAPHPPFSAEDLWMIPLSSYNHPIQLSFTNICTA